MNETLKARMRALGFRLILGTLKEDWFDKLQKLPLGTPRKEVLKIRFSEDPIRAQLAQEFRASFKIVRNKRSE